MTTCTNQSDANKSNEACERTREAELVERMHANDAMLCVRVYEAGAHLAGGAAQ